MKNVLITGSTGEGHSLTRDERVEVFEAWSTAGMENGIQVVAHVGSNCLEDAKYLAAAAADIGLFASAAIAPSYHKPGSIKALVNWCSTIAAAAPSLRIPNLAGVKFTNADLETYQRCLAVEDGRFDIVGNR